MIKTRAFVGLFLLVLLSSIFASIYHVPTVSAAATFSFDPGVGNSQPGILVTDGGQPVELYQTPGVNTSYASTIGNCQVAIQLPKKNSSTGVLNITLSNNNSQTGSVNACQFNAMLPSFSSTYPNLNTTYQISNIGGQIIQTGAWLDHSEIIFNFNGKDLVFRDDKIDDQLNFNIVNAPDNCSKADIINGFNNHPGSDIRNATDNPAANITLSTAMSGGCSQQTYKIKFNDTSNYNSYFSWQDAGTIESSDLTGIIFVQANGAGPYVDNGKGRSADATCKSQLTTSGVGASSGSLVLSYSSTTHTLYEGWPNNISGAPLHADGFGCFVSNPINVPIANPGNNSSKASGSALAAAANNDPNSNPSLSCENKIGISDIFNGQAIGKGLNWLVCNVIRAVNGAINVFDNIIQSSLYFSSSDLNVKDQGYYQAWSAFRYISLGLLVLVGLAMVISQMIGIGIFDAYTVKKLLPRIFAAAILITLSWSLAKIAIDVVNIIGSSIRGLLYAPFGGADRIAASISPNGTTTAVGTGAFAGAAIGGYFLIGTTNWLVILSFALPALIAIIIGFFIVILRQAVIVLMVIVAPLAVVAYILPNTDKVWKLWRENFFRALIMYPLIVAFLSIGRVFAYIIMQSHTSAGGLNQMVAIVAYFGPYFAIPLTFKFAGGILGGIHGTLNNKSHGFMAANKKFRRGQQSKTWELTKTGKRYGGGNENNFRGRMNTALQSASLMNKAGIRPTKWGAKIGAARSNVAMQQRAAMMEDKDYTWKGDDDLNRAASESADEAGLRNILTTRYGERYNGAHGAENLNRDVAKVESVRRKYGNDAFRQATFMQAVAGGTAFKTTAEVWKAAGAVSGSDNGVLADLVAKGRSSAMNAGRVDWGGAGFNDTFTAARALRDNNLSINDANNFLHDKVIDSQGAGILLHPSMKQGVVENLAPVMVERLNSAIAGGDDRRVAQELASTAGVLDAMSQSNPMKARAVADIVMDHGIIAYGGHETVRDLMEAYRGDDSFNQMRREYQNAAVQQAAGQTRGPVQPGSPPAGPPTAPPGPI